MSYSLVLAFDTDDEEFVRGYEAAYVYHVLLLDEVHDEVDFTVHATNAEMMLRIADATGRTVRSEDLDERWIRVFFKREP